MGSYKYKLCNAIKKAVAEISEVDITELSRVKEGIYDAFYKAMDYSLGSAENALTLMQLSGKTLEDFKKEVNYKFEKFKGISNYSNALLAATVFHDGLHNKSDLNNLFSLALKLEDNFHFDVDYNDNGVIQRMPFIQCAIEKGGEPRLVWELIEKSHNLGLKFQSGYLAEQLKNAVLHNDQVLYGYVVKIVKTVAMPNLKLALANTLKHYLSLQGIAQDILDLFEQHTIPEYADHHANPTPKVEYSGGYLESQFVHYF